MKNHNEPMVHKKGMTISNGNFDRVTATIEPDSATTELCQVAAPKLCGSTSRTSPDELAYLPQQQSTMAKLSMDTLNSAPSWLNQGPTDQQYWDQGLSSELATPGLSYLVDASTASLQGHAIVTPQNDSPVILSAAEQTLSSDTGLYLHDCDEFYNMIEYNMTDYYKMIYGEGFLGQDFLSLTDPLTAGMGSDQDVPPHFDTNLPLWN
ncbi:hypothetical protein PWT90_10606 [Aphanocladium album]|nr:hypothetical protein PWT90_10606 [Aphanocladium album]